MVIVGNRVEDQGVHDVLRFGRAGRDGGDTTVNDAHREGIGNRSPSSRDNETNYGLAGAGAAGAVGAAAEAGTLPPASTICLASTLTTVASLRSADR